MDKTGGRRTIKRLTQARDDGDCDGLWKREWRAVQIRQVLGGVGLNMGKRMEMESPRRMLWFMACKISLTVMPYVERENREEEQVLVGATEFSLGDKVI